MNTYLIRVPHPASVVTKTYRVSARNRAEALEIMSCDHCKLFPMDEETSSLGPRSPQESWEIVECQDQ